jgi:hypothetical protein
MVNISYLSINKSYNFIAVSTSYSYINVKIKIFNIIILCKSI